MQKEVLIEFKGITKSFGDKKVLDNLNLTIDKGDIFGILGPSGSGKSTLMKILMGIELPDSGKVIFKGQDISRQPLLLRKITGLTTQENSFYDKLSVRENMGYYANLYSVNRKGLGAHIDSILRSVKLDHSKDTLAGSLSGGMKRRLDFAISLLHDPELLIMDEPTTGLDPILVKQFWHIIKETQKRGKTMLVISHLFHEVKENCSRAGILCKGTITSFNVTENTDVMKEFEKVVG
jgi:ABC-2 type transport system ATP-binding protein